jgi:hypothetical protein
MRSYDKVLKPYRTGEVMASNRGHQDQLDFVELWEIHDRRTHRIMVVASGHKRFLRNEVDLLQLDGLPFVGVGFTPRARSFWTTSDAKYLLTHQAESTDISLQGMKHRRASIAKFLYSEDAINPDQLDNMQSSEVMAGIKVNGGASIREAIQILQQPVDLSFEMAKEGVRRDARSVVGFSRNQMGEFDASSRRTASEALIVNQRSEQRTNRRQAALSVAYKQIFQKINRIIFEYWRTPRITQVVDQQGIQKFIEFTGPQLKGEYDYEISFSSEAPPSLGQRRQDALNQYMVMREDPAVDPIGLRRYIANAYNDPEFSSMFRKEVLQGAEIPVPLQSLQGGAGAGSQNGGTGQAGGSLSNMRLPGQ